MFKDEPYVFEQQTDGYYQYTRFKYNLEVTDEMGSKGKCGMVDEARLMFCETPLSNFRHKGREWGFITKGNGFLEYIPEEPSNVSNDDIPTSLFS